MLQLIHDCKKLVWATRCVPVAHVVGGDQPFIRRLVGISTSHQVGLIYIMGLQDEAAEKWLHMDKRQLRSLRRPPTTNTW